MIYNIKKEDLEIDKEKRRHEMLILYELTEAVHNQLGGRSGADVRNIEKFSFPPT